MTTTNPIVPPPELAEEWRMDYMGRGHAFIDVAIKAVQWGADQELEACVEWTESYVGCGDALRLDRRPKPPSLKEQALQILDTHGNLTRAEADTIRRALEALPND